MNRGCDGNSARLVHIDYGSKGSAGLYLVQLLKAYTGPVPVDAYVQSEFPADLAPGRKIRLFDRLSRFIPLAKWKQIYKVLDLYVCFAWIAIALRFKTRKERLFVVVQFFQSFHAYEWLFRRISRYCTLIVTVHDAVELRHNYPSFILSPRDDILKHAHALIVHGKTSAAQLGYLGKPMFQIPFPLMIPEPGGPHRVKFEDGISRFLFIGHIRFEKGIDVLAEAWRKLPEDVHRRVSLTIAGTCDEDTLATLADLRNCTLCIGYLDDKQFFDLIRSSSYVVLPYIGGTNSGVLSIATALNTPCITTRIPLFTESPFFEEDLAVRGASDLAALVAKLSFNHPQDYCSYSKRILSRKADYQSVFSTQVGAMYQMILEEQSMDQRRDYAS